MATASLITYVDSNVNQEGESSNNLTLPLPEEERLLYYKKGRSCGNCFIPTGSLIDEWYLQELDQYSMLSIDC